MIRQTTMIFLLYLMASCSGGGEKTEATGGIPGARTDLPKTLAEVEKDFASFKGIGPVTSVTLEEAISEEMAAAGKVIFDAKCSACHKTDKRFIGPEPKNVLSRRTPEWVMNMILNPEEMVSKDPIGKLLLVEYNGSPMANQNLTQDEARSVLEYFRTL